MRYSCNFSIQSPAGRQRDDVVYFDAMRYGSTIHAEDGHVAAVPRRGGDSESGGVIVDDASDG
jgi:hypothetical protein